MDALNVWLPKYGKLTLGQMVERLEAAETRAQRLEEALRDCVVQIEYEHGKFGGTGSGETVLHRTRALLAEEAKP